MRIPFGTITITEKAKKLINEALDSNRISNGKYVREFEEKFAELLGVKEAVAVSSGTDADILAMSVLYDFGAKRGDEIIVPSLSFVATGNAVLHAGFTPVFVDIERDTLNINASKIEEKITSKTKAIMPVHLMGKPADMDKINEIAKKYKLYVIEDAAEAHGTYYKGKPAGNLADIGAFSLYIAHIITTGEGGIVTTNNADFAEILLSLRCHGRACKCKKCVLNVSSGYCTKRFSYAENMDIRFMFERVGYSSKMNELEAAIGLGALENYYQILEKRRANLYYLMENFKQFSPNLKTITKEEYEEIGPHALPIIVQESANFSRNQLTDYLEKNGIDTRSLFLSMPTQCEGFKNLGYKYGEFPNAEYMGHNGIHIGVHQDLGKPECDYVLNVINDFIKKHR
ncbi:DegT/DnrJ/EryC1/StrS family aminotransferase [Candidatus Dependentiae bacterium]|nr:DegT/DnrJ/EryC1/StrS family aminotransferase [Candidatus Dependentiae bacterium]